MASVFKIKSGKNKGKYKSVVYLPKKPGDTKRKRKEFWGDSSAEVSAKATDLEYQIQHNLYVDPGNTNLREYLKEWSRVYCNDKAVTTQALYKMYIEKHLVPEREKDESTLGDILLRDLMPIHIQEFINNKMIKKSDKEPGLKGKTVNKLLAVLNSALKDAVSNRLLLLNPCDSIKRPKKEKFEPIIYNEAQMSKLLDVVSGTFDEICILLAGYVGLRRGEVFGLRWKDINFKAHTISVKETITRFDTYVVKDPKSDKGTRTIATPAFVFDILQKYRDSLKVIPERVCDKFKPQSYSEHFRNLLIKNKLPQIRFHDLRHFNGTIMMKYHVPDPVAAKRLGHADPSTTKIYQHSQSDMEQLAADILNEVYQRSRGNANADV